MPPCLCYFEPENKVEATKEQAGENKEVAVLQGRNTQAMIRYRNPDPVRFFILITHGAD